MPYHHKKDIEFLLSMSMDAPGCFNSFSEAYVLPGSPYSIH